MQRAIVGAGGSRAGLYHVSASRLTRLWWLVPCKPMTSIMTMPTGVFVGYGSAGAMLEDCGNCFLGLFFRVFWPCICFLCTATFFCFSIGTHNFPMRRLTACYCRLCM